MKNNNFQDQKANLVPRPGILYRANLKHANMSVPSNSSQPPMPPNYPYPFNQQISMPVYNPNFKSGNAQISQMPIPNQDYLAGQETNQIERILGHRTDPLSNNRQYCVKFKDKSYNDLSWVNADSFYRNQDLLNEYNRFHFEPQNNPGFNPHFLIPERVLTVKRRKYLVKWNELDCMYSTWEDESNLIKLNQSYNPLHDLIREYKQRIQPSPKDSSKPKNSFYTPIIELVGPNSGKKLTPDQVDAFNFLENAWHRSQNILIADEEKVGIKISVSMFIKHIFDLQNGHFQPFLIVTSQFLVPKWETILNEWANLPYLPYIGSKESLHIMKKYDFTKPGSTDDDLIFPLYITTSNIIENDKQLFGSCYWHYVIIDDTVPNKRLFDKTVLESLGSTIKSKNRLILTPSLQKVNPHFVFDYFHFLDSNVFNDQNEFFTRHLNNGLIKYDDELSNFSLSHYENSEKNFQITEMFVKCPITKIQQESIRSLYQSNIQYLSDTKNWTNDRKLQQIVMDMKKILSHPYIIDGNEKLIHESIQKGVYGDLNNEDALYKASGKMFILSLMLKKFHLSKKKVVILCQMKETIDLIQKLMKDNNYLYEQIDISTRGRSRFDAMMRFNNPSSNIFAFILDAKSGYYTMEADYVIIYESSWNPINDIFISSKILTLNKKKMVYRLVTEDSFETTFFENEPLLTNFDGSLIAQSDISKIDMFIRSGAYYAFKDIDFDLDEVDIDDILNDNSKSLVYTAINNNSVHVSLENPTVRNKVTTPNFWEPLLTHVQNDKNSLYVVKLKKHENIPQKKEENDDLEDFEEEFIEGKFTNDEEDENGWTSKKIFQLVNFILHFGFQLAKISSILSVDVDEIEKVLSILIYHLLENTSVEFPIIENFLMSKFNKSDLNRKQFKSRLNKDQFTTLYSDEIDSIASNKTAAKLKRIEAMLFINTSMQATDLNKKIPVIPSSKSLIESDFMLFQGVNKYGFPLMKLPQNIDLSLNEANSRIVELVKKMSALFVDFSNEAGINLDLTPQNLIDAIKIPSLSDKKKIFEAIQKVGIDDKEKTFEISKLPPEKYAVFLTYMEQFPQIAESVFCHKKVPDSYFGGQVSRKTIQSTIFNAAVLKYIKDPSTDLGELSHENELIFDYLKNNGFQNLNEQDIFVEKFGKDPKDGLSTFIEKYFKDQRQIIIKTFLGERHSTTSTNKTTKKRKAAKTEVLDFPSDYVLTEQDINNLLPLKINDGLIITSLGKVVTDRPKFHNSRYLYMDGFTSEKLFSSVIRPSKAEWYVSRIFDTGKEKPRFSVELKKKPSIRFEGSYPSCPWLLFLKAIRRTRKRRQEEKSISISGPEQYGLSAPIVRELMAHMPGADQCERFNKPSKSKTKVRKTSRPKKIDIAAEYEKQKLLSDHRSVVEKVKDDIRKKQRKKAQMKREAKRKKLAEILKQRNKKKAIYTISSSSDSYSYDYYDSYSDDYSNQSEEEEEDTSEYEKEITQKPKEVPIKPRKRKPASTKPQDPKKSETKPIKPSEKAEPLSEPTKPVKPSEKVKSLPKKTKPTKVTSKVHDKNEVFSKFLYDDQLEQEREKALDYFFNPDPNVLYIDHDVFAQFLRMKYNIQPGVDPVAFYIQSKQDV